MQSAWSDDAASAIIAELTERSLDSYVPPSFMAWAHLARGDIDDTLHFMQEAARVRDAWLIFHRRATAVFPGDPRIDRLLDQIGF